MTNQGISKTTANVALLIIITVILAVLTAGWMVPQPYRPVGLTITPTIYSSENNLGVLNEMAIFELRIWNEMPTPEDLEITVTANDELILSKTIRIDANSSRNETITQRLSNIGMWIVKTNHNQETIDSYSFKTLTNTIEADIEIEALENIRKSANDSSIIVLVGILGLIMGIITTILKFRKKDKNKPTSQNIDY